MLVEINLLPEREPKKFAFLIALLSIIAVILLGGVIYLLEGQSAKNELNSITRQISVVNKLIKKDNNHTETSSAKNSVSQLESAIKWAKDYPIQTIPVMHKLTSLLPERGFIQSFGYKEDGTVTLTVQFDSARDAAYYVTNLTNSQWISDVSLNSLTAQAAKDSSNPATNTNNMAVTTNGTSTTVTGNSGTTNTTVPNTATGTQPAPSGNQTNQTNQTSSSPGANAQAANQSSGQATSGNSSTNDNLLPRYIGQFEIKLDHNNVKEAIKKNNSKQEGVSGS